MRKETIYQWHTGKVSKPMRLMVVTDLHDAPYEDILPMLDGADCLLVVGDVANRYQQTFTTGMHFCAEAAKRVPTFFSLGNHEARLDNLPTFLDDMKQTGATLLINSFAQLGELTIGGWYRPENLGMPDMIDEFERQPGCKVLMCHRPEDYIQHLRGRDVDLVLAGHAHGGQVRLFGRGLYAPGQGLLPKYTYGVVDRRMIISSGASNVVHAPRWGNPCEVVRIELD
ncbi:MAG: metallophosphoesterase [Eubacteriales bacterium]|nr:metallophosphoesterase [Eubacteriales bacterium]